MPSGRTTSRIASAQRTPRAVEGREEAIAGELARAIREGVSRDGEALFPIMPWFMYTGMLDEDAGPVPAIPRNDTVAYGEYLAKVARCEFCHTQYSKNLTSHETGLGNWTRDVFIARFRVHTAPFPVTEEQNSEMNWVAFSGMTDEDLGAIWDYLRTLPPLEAKLLERAD